MPKWTLRLVNAASAARMDTRPPTIPLNVGTTTFGRDASAPPDAQATCVALRSTHISRLHAVITLVEGASPVLRDDSTNGCVLFRTPGRRRVAVKKASVTLAPGDEVRFGVGEAALDEGDLEYLYRVRAEEVTQLAAATPVTAGSIRLGPTAVPPPSVAVAPTTPASTGVAAHPTKRPREAGHTSPGVTTATSRQQAQRSGQRSPGRSLEPDLRPAPDAALLRQLLRLPLPRPHTPPHGAPTGAPLTAAVLGRAGPSDPRAAGHAAGHGSAAGPCQGHDRCATGVHPPGALRVRVRALAASHLGDGAWPGLLRYVGGTTAAAADSPATAYWQCAQVALDESVLADCLAQLLRRHLAPHRAYPSPVAHPPTIHYLEPGAACTVPPLRRDGPDEEREQLALRDRAHNELQQVVQKLPRADGAGAPERWPDTVPLGLVLLRQGYHTNIPPHMGRVLGSGTKVSQP